MPRFVTFAQVAADLCYDLSGPNGAKATDALRKWLAKYGLRPELRRGLYRQEQIDAVIDRLRLAQARSRNRGFQSHAARFQQRKGAHHGALVTGKAVMQVHAETVDEGAAPRPLNSLDRQAAR